MKRRIIILLLAGMLMCSLTGCGEPQSNEVDKASLEFSNLKTIDEKEHLAYDLDTKVVYYMFSSKEYSGYQGYGYSYFSPYISENGKFCRYIDNKIVEITNDTED